MEYLLGKKIAITFDYVMQYGGAEVILIELLNIFPNASLYTPILWKGNIPNDVWAKIIKHRVYVSFLNKFYFMRKVWKFFLPFNAKFFENLDLDNYDVVISISSGFAKWLNCKSHTKHIAYINTPPRFLWGMQTTTFEKIPRFIRFLLSFQLNKWRRKDKYYARQADKIYGNSQNIVNKIKKFYKTDAYVLYPPVSIKHMSVSKDIFMNQKDFYLIINRLVAYKQIDKVIEAFNILGKTLVIIGDGPEISNLKRIAGEKIFFTGFVDEKIKYSYLASCKALIYPGEEDFGIGMVESLLFGKPVIAYKGGGAIEILDEKSGKFFGSHDPEVIKKTILSFEEQNYSSTYIKERAEKFSVQKFRDNIGNILKGLF